MWSPRSRPLVLPLVASLGLTALLASSCSTDGSDDGSGAAPPSVVATTSIWADVTSRVACDRVRVTSLVPIGVDAHSYEPSVQDADELRGAALVVANGLGLEEGALDAVEAAEADGVEVVELGEQLEPIDAEHADDTEHEHGDGSDPHVWMDPDRVAAAVPLIAAGLESVDGLEVDAAQIQQCADDYVTELTALSAELDDRFAQLTPSQRKLVTNHEALGYLADRFDLEVIGAVVPSTSSLGESNARDLDELATTMQEQGVTRIYGEVTGSDEVAAALAERVGSQVEIVELYTESLGEEGSGASTYVDMMRTNGRLIAGE